jgi:hypothetical protein
MISSSLRFIYLHAPKTGGNSIQTLLQPFSDDAIVLKGHQDGRDRFEIKGNVTPRKHAYLSDYFKALGNGIDVYKTIISVRQPFHRAISFYFSPHRWMRKCEGAEGWALESAFWNLDEFEKSIESMAPMIDFLKIDDVPVRPDHIIRFENIAEDFESCATAIGFRSSLAELPHVNRSAAAHMARDALNDADAERLVKERFAADYKFFDYH